MRLIDADALLRQIEDPRRDPNSYGAQRAAAVARYVRRAPTVETAQALLENFNEAESCIYEIEDALNRGSDNDWARHAIEDYEKHRQEIARSGVDEPRTGEWLPSPDGMTPTLCGNCFEPALFTHEIDDFGEGFHRYQSKYCPHCGAMMTKKEVPNR